MATFPYMLNLNKQQILYISLSFPQVHTILTTDIFGVIRSLMAFRLTGGNKGKQHVYSYL